MINKVTVYNMYNGHCAYCGIQLSYSSCTIDHITPKSQQRSGADRIENLNPCCQKCNSVKGARNVNQFRKYLATCQDDLEEKNAKLVLLKRLGIVGYNFSTVKFYFEKIKSQTDYPRDLTGEEISLRDEEIREEYIEEMRIEAARIKYESQLRKDAIKHFELDKRRTKHYSNFQLS